MDISRLGDEEIGICIIGIERQRLHLAARGK